MAKPQSAVDHKTIRKWNADLKALADIKDDIAVAIEAGVPNADKVLESCQACEAAIIKLKAQYAPGQ